MIIDCKRPGFPFQSFHYVKRISTAIPGAGMSLGFIVAETFYISQSHSLMKIVIVARPNGAGKTTFARFLLASIPEITHYQNVDTIAAGLAPLKPETAAVDAGRFMLSQMDHLVTMNLNFAFETTLSSKNYLRKIKQWRAGGYEVRLVFLRLPNQEFAINRVKQRVKQGGHNIPEDVIRRRFDRGTENLGFYKKIVTSWQVFDNSIMPPILLESSEDRNEKRKK